MKTEFKKNYPIEIYHQKDGHYSTSSLKRLLQSPLHFKYPPEQEPKKFFDIGSAVHTLLLEPHLWDKYFVVYDTDKRAEPEKTMASNKNKEWMAEIELKAEGKILITVKDKEEVDTMVERVLEDPFVVDLLSGPGWNEPSIYWTDFKRKQNLKTRPDRIRANMVIVDIKTSADASPEGFARSVGKYRYDVQAAMQVDGVQAHFKKKVPYYFYIAIETKPPYAHGVYLLKDDSIWTGRQTYKSLLDVINECEEKKEWPAYGYWAKQLPDKILRTKVPHYINVNLYQY